jgi:hypothetical protein
VRRSLSETSKKRMRANTEPDPETTPHVTDEQEGQASSRMEASKEPAQDEEKRRVAEKLRARERNS